MANCAPVQAVTRPPRADRAPSSPRSKPLIASRGATSVLMNEQDAALVLQLQRLRERLDAQSVRVLRGDGLGCLRQVAPGTLDLVLIDPPFEDRDELAHMAEAVMGALAKWPTGTFIFWRSLKNLWAADRFDNGLAEWLISEKDFEPEKILRADLWIRDLSSEGKLAGAGVVIINPPFTLEDKPILMRETINVIAKVFGSIFETMSAEEHEKN